MNAQEAIQVLQQHQLWRNGLPPYEHGGEGMPHTPSQLGEALTHAIEYMKRGAPEGWQLVPKEPVYEMQNAGKWAAFEYADGDEELEEYAADNDECALIYKAMLSAAPEPPREYLKHSEGE